MLFVFWCCGTQVNVGKVAKNNSIANNENVIKIQSGCRFLASIHCFMIQNEIVLEFECSIKTHKCVTHNFYVI